MKFWLPKIGLPKVRLPKIALPKPALPKLSLRSRQLVMGATALALIGAGGLVWFVVRPMLAKPDNPVQETAGAAPEKAPEAPAGAEKAEQKAGSPGKDEKAEAAEGGGAKNDGAKTGEAKPEKAKEEKQAAAPLPPPEPPGEPEVLIRRLQDLQERVAAGDAASYAEQPRFLRRIAQRFAAQPPEVWSRKQGAQALILYLLSGGSSAVGRKILGEHTFAASEEPLAKGAIAYLENVEGADRDNLLNLDPTALDLSLGAQVAYVQSILLTGADRPRALAKLDLARLLAPGGLVEEAALRREVGLLSETTDFDKFAGLARQYWERFRASPYAENFLRQFLVSVARVSQRIKFSEWAQLDEFIESLKPETRRALYLVMAQTAAVGGNAGLGDMAARRALALLAANSVERQRALLYRAAAEVGGADFAHGPALLSDVDRAKLPPGDQPIYDAVALVSARIFGAPESKFAAPPPGVANDLDATLAQAESSVKDADAALENIRKSMERKSR